MGLAGMTCDQPPEDIHVLYKELLKGGITKQFFYATGCDEFARRSMRNTST